MNRDNTIIHYPKQCYQLFSALFVPRHIYGVRERPKNLILVDFFLRNHSLQITIERNPRIVHANISKTRFLYVFTVKDALLRDLHLTSTLPLMNLFHQRRFPLEFVMNELVNRRTT